MAEIYTIKRGDTLQSIADAHHISIETLAHANPNANPKQLVVGDRLTIDLPHAGKALHKLDRLDHLKFPGELKAKPKHFQPGDSVAITVPPYPLLGKESHYVYGVVQKVENGDYVLALPPKQIQAIQDSHLRLNSVLYTYDPETHTIKANKGLVRSADPSRIQILK